MILNYFVTKEGRVFNPKGKELKQHDRKGYKYVCINRKKYSVHRLVALEFISNPNNLPEVDHIDGDPYNNNVENLRWVTRQENEMNPITRKRISIANKGKKVTEEQRAKISKTLTGRKQTQETKEKRAQKLRGKKRPQYVIDAMVNACKKRVSCTNIKTGEEYVFESQKAAAVFCGLSPATISAYVRGKIKSKQFIWKRK